MPRRSFFSSKRARAGMAASIRGETALGRATLTLMGQTMVTTRRRQWVLSPGEQVLTAQWICPGTCGNGPHRSTISSTRRLAEASLCCTGVRGPAMQTTRVASTASATFLVLVGAPAGFVVRGNVVEKDRRLHLSAPQPDGISRVVSARSSDL